MKAVGGAETVRVDTRTEDVVSRLRAIFDAAPCIVAYVDAGRIYRFNNRAYQTWLGIDPTSLTGRSVEDVLGPAAYESVRKHVDAALAGQHVEFESSIPYVGGTRYVHATYAPDISPEGVVLGYTGYVFDISAQKAREAELKEQRDLYEALLRAASDVGEGVTLSRNGMKLEFVNAAFARIVGRPVEALVAPDFDPSCILAPGEEERIRRELSIPRGTTTDRPLQFRVKIVRPDGEVRETSVAGTGIMLRGEAHRISIVRDVTDERRDHEALETARRQLAMTEKLAALGSLVNGVAHEIRTPLTIIETSAHLLQLRASKAAQLGDASAFIQELPETTQTITGAIERANNLVKSLRRFGRHEEARREAQDLAPLVEEAVELFHAANRGRVHVEVDLVPTPPVPVDKAKIQQVVLNLMENAADAVHGSTKPIRVRTLVLDGSPALEVLDDGVGMDAATLARMYDPLFTTKERGTGLGLSITKRIVDEHGASIDCESTPGRGSRFTVRFVSP